MIDLKLSTNSVKLVPANGASSLKEIQTMSEISELYTSCKESFDSLTVKERTEILRKYIESFGFQIENIKDSNKSLIENDFFIGYNISEGGKKKGIYKVFTNSGTVGFQKYGTGSSFKRDGFLTETGVFEIV